MANTDLPTTSRLRPRGGPGLFKWLAAGYALSLGVLLVTGGRLGDKFGRRRTFLIGITGFTLASPACGLAWSPVSIIVARVVQGGFGALMIPQRFGIILSVFPRDKVGKAFRTYGPVLGLASVGGPILAGVLITANLAGLSWRPMFLVNVILGGAGLLAGWRLLPHDTWKRSTVIDTAGSALLAATMLGLLYGLIQGSGSGWGIAAIASLAAGAATAVLVSPAMGVVGLGMGVTFSTLFDTAIGDVDPDQAGSATGSLSAVRQLANTIGPAVITAVYLGAVAGGQVHAMTVGLAVIVAIAAPSAVTVSLLPRKPRPDLDSERSR